MSLNSPSSLRHVHRNLSVERLESRRLLAATLLLGAPASVRTGEAMHIPAEVGNLSPGGAAHGEALATPLSARLGEVEISFQGSLPFSRITETSAVNGLVYTVGWTSSRRGLAIEWDAQTREGREIQVDHLTNPSGVWASDAFVHGVGKLGGETVIFGNRLVEPGFHRATIWDTSGVPRDVSEVQFPSGGRPHGEIRRITQSGFMTGDQQGVGVVWTPDGKAHILPRTPLTDALSYTSTGIDITSDGRFISGMLGSDAAVWRAIGDPAYGNYELMFYNAGHFPFRFPEPDDGFSPQVGRFVLNSDRFGVVMGAEYESTSGIRSGVWSVETGLGIQTFGHSLVLDAINIGGDVFLVTNDFTEQSGAIWLLGQDQPVLLRDILGSDFSNNFIRWGGLFRLPDDRGIGILGSGIVNDVETHFIARIDLVDADFEYLVDIDLDGAFDVSHFGREKTEIPLRIDQSGSYTVQVQVRRGEEIVAGAFTTIDVTPHPEGTLSPAQIPMDINGDGILTPLDALLVLNHISRVNRGIEDVDFGRFNVSGNGSVAPLDALLILNQLRRGDGPGQVLPSIELLVDSGVAGDGFTNDPSIIGQLPIQGDVYMRMGDTVRNVTEARGSEGRFVLPKEDLFELFPEAADDGDKEVRIWVGLENAPDHLQTRLKFAYKGTPPREFKTYGIGENGRISWEASQGASRYDVGFRVLAGGPVNWISQDLRSLSSTGDSLIDEAIELIVLARDSAGNQTESTHSLVSA